MPIINIYEAKARLSNLVDQAAAGEDVIIGRNGKPIARITVLTPPKRSVRFGVLKGRIKIAADFDAPLPDATIASFESR
ncbi:MAG: type II toxin-antitoxin system Phd/YefM family antitoxin [Casimicrobiaceae bacterium]